MGRNDLEKACARAYPEMKSLLRKLRAAGVDVYLSGSGSTLFTVHDDFACRDQTQEVLGRVCDGVSIMRAQSYQR
jgi:4-diphosphocytidyl-2C-methyl-D-erythritol kinase